MIDTNDITDPAARHEREARDQQLYDFVRRGQDAQAAVDASISTARHSPAPTRERMAEIAKRPRRPAVTPLRAKGIEKIADLVRHRLKLRSGLYAIHADDKDAVKAALEYLDELALFHRRHR
jgi:hypothetical protein